MFQKLLRELQFDYNLKRITSTLHEDLCKFMIKSHAVFLRMRNVLDKICRENQNTHFIFNNFLFMKTMLFIERHAKDDNMIQCRKDAI